jgi:Kef-type K+ transport system membrane component KefB
MIGLAAVMFVIIRAVGERLQARAEPEAVPTGFTASQGTDIFFHLLLALAVIILTARAMGAVFSFFQQPAVVGEIVSGIMLGPSLLGRIAPGAFTHLLPSSVAPFLGVLAQLGVIVYMFLVGLELDTRVIRRSRHAAIAISHASIVVPFVLGSALALVLYPVLSSSAVRFTVFALFIGVSLSVTAFPVLARILSDRRMIGTQMGAIALTCAAVDDVTAWCLLALVVGIAQARTPDAVRTVVLTVAFIAFVFVVIRPVVRRVLARLEASPQLTRTSLAGILVAMLASAMTTEYIGIHGIFGAFLFGATIPSGTRVARELHDRLDDLIAVMFLPAFFAFTGMRTNIALITGAQNWLFCGVILLVACVGKFGGTLVASRFTGIGWRDSAALGVLMNTRGLVELIVLNIGLDLHVISLRLFTMLVLMALITTFMTTPILHVLLRKHPWPQVERMPA